MDELLGEGDGIHGLPNHMCNKVDASRRIPYLATPDSPNEKTNFSGPICAGAEDFDEARLRYGILVNGEHPFGTCSLCCNKPSVQASRNPSIGVESLYRDRRYLRHLTKNRVSMST